MSTTAGSDPRCRCGAEVEKRDLSTGPFRITDGPPESRWVWVHKDYYRNLSHAAYDVHIFVPITPTALKARDGEGEA